MQVEGEKRMKIVAAVWWRGGPAEGRRSGGTKGAKMLNTPTHTSEIHPHGTRRKVHNRGTHPTKFKDTFGHTWPKHNFWPAVPDVQLAWLILLFCAATGANILLGPAANVTWANFSKGRIFVGQEKMVAQMACVPQNKNSMCSQPKKMSVTRKFCDWRHQHGGWSQ